MTLPEFDLVQTQFLKKYDLESRERWVIARWQSYLTMKAMGSKIGKPTDIYLFNWETKEQTKNLELLKDKDLMDKLFPPTI